MLYLQYTHPYNPLPQTQKHDRLCRAIVWLKRATHLEHFVHQYECDDTDMVFEVCHPLLRMRLFLIEFMYYISCAMEKSIYSSVRSCIVLASSMLKWCMYLYIREWCLDGCSASVAKAHHIFLLHLYLINHHFATAYGASVAGAVHCAIVQAQHYACAYTPLQFFVAEFQYLSVCLCALYHKLFKFFICHPIPNFQVRI